MSYEVKNVKGFMGMDCPGFNATLVRDGKKVATVVDDGSGGCLSIHWLDSDGPRVDVPWTTQDGGPWTIKGCTVEQAKLYEVIRGKTWCLGPECKNMVIRVDMDHFISGLVDNFENAKRFKRICKTKTLFRLKTDKDGEWRTLSSPFSKRIKDMIVVRYGDQVVEIYNETLGQVAA